MSRASVLFFLMFLAGTARSEPIRVASWNLGWHISQAEVPVWISKCSETFLRDSTDGIWHRAPKGTPNSRSGWEITEPRARVEGVDLAVMPPCNVYETPVKKGIAVTPAAYSKRAQQAAMLIATAVRPDVIAFQEVSGSQSIREVLGTAESDYFICSFDGQYKVQRLAFAWLRKFGQAVGGCRVHRALSLPDRPADVQVRPALELTLNVRGRTIRFLTVHLKSSCVSPLDGGQLDKATSPSDACAILEEQTRPLEEVVEALPLGADDFVVLGDFNRNLWHEYLGVAGAEPVRSDGQTDLTSPRTTPARTRNLFREVFDNQPPSTQAVLLTEMCDGPEQVQRACEAAKMRALTAPEKAILTTKSGLGCRNPVGLDHIIVSHGLMQYAGAATKIALGRFGRSMGPQPPDYPDPLLAISDHCPLLVEIDLP